MLASLGSILASWTLFLVGASSGEAELLQKCRPHQT
jgi:hypothetical protein